MTAILDADVLIGALDGADAHHRQARDVLTTWQQQNERRLISVLNLTEVLIAPASRHEAASSSAGSDRSARSDRPPPERGHRRRCRSATQPPRDQPRRRLLSCDRAAHERIRCVIRCKGDPSGRDRADRRRLTSRGGTRRFPSWPQSKHCPKRLHSGEAPALSARAKSVPRGRAPRGEGGRGRAGRGRRPQPVQHEAEVRRQASGATSMVASTIGRSDQKSTVEIGGREVVAHDALDARPRNELLVDRASSSRTSPHETGRGRLAERQARAGCGGGVGATRPRRRAARRSSGCVVVFERAPGDSTSSPACSLEEGVDERLARREVAVERPGPEPGAFGDAVDRGIDARPPRRPHPPQPRAAHDYAGRLGADAVAVVRHLRILEETEQVPFLLGSAGRMDAAFAALGRVVVRFRYLVVVVWLAAVVVTTAAFPSLGSEVNNNNSQFLPASAPSSRAATLAAPLLGGVSARQRSHDRGRARRRHASDPPTRRARARWSRRCARCPEVDLVRELGASPDEQAVQILVRARDQSGRHRDARRR